MRALITGATGLVGKHLVGRLEDVVVLSRNPDEARRRLGKVEAYAWNPEGGPAPAEALRGVEVVFNLAGEPVFEGRWTDEKKRRIRDSRVVGTRNLVSAIAALERRPKVLVSASAVGYYGDRGDEELDERSTRRPRISRRSLRGLGTRSDGGRAAWHPRGLRTDWNRSRSRRRGAGRDANSVSDGNGRPARQRAAVDAMGPYQGPGWSDAACEPERRDPWADERGRATPGHQRRFYARAGECSPPAGLAPGAAHSTSPRAWRGRATS